MPRNETFDVSITFWVEVEGNWRSDAYWEETEIKIP